MKKPFKFIDNLDEEFFDSLIKEGIVVKFLELGNTIKCTIRGLDMLLIIKSSGMYVIVGSKGLRLENLAINSPSESFQNFWNRLNWNKLIEYLDIEDI